MSAIQIDKKYGQIVDRQTDTHAVLEGCEQWHHESLWRTSRETMVKRDYAIATRELEQSILPSARNI